MSTYDPDAESKFARRKTAASCIKKVPCGSEWCPCTLSPEELKEFDVMTWCKHNEIDDQRSLALLHLKEKV